MRLVLIGLFCIAFFTAAIGISCPGPVDSSQDSGTVVAPASGDYDDESLITPVPSDTTYPDDACQDRFVSVGTMGLERTYPVSVELSDGRVLMAGGINEQSLHRTEVFDPRTGSWTTVAPMVVGRYSHALALLPDGRVLAAGGQFMPRGWYVTTENLSSAEIYDPATDRWTQIADMPIPMWFGYPPIRLPSGHIFLVGRVDDTSAPLRAVLFDPETEQFKFSAPSPFGQMMEVVALDGGDVLAVQGGNPATYLWNEASDVWREASPRLDSQLGLSQIVMTSIGPLSVGDGGYSQVYSVEEDQWQEVGNALPPEKTQVGLVVAFGGGALMIGGRWSDANQVLEPVVFPTVSAFDPVTRTWAPAGSMRRARTAFEALPLRDGRVMVMGGHGPRISGDFDSVEIYDPSLPSDCPPDWDGGWSDWDGGR